MSGTTLSPALPRTGRPALPRRARAAAGWAGAASAGLAILGVGGGLLGALNGWPDLLNHFSVLWLALALFGATLCIAVRDQAPARLGLLFALLAGLGAGLPLAAEAAAGRAAAPAIPAPRGALRVLTFNLWDGNLSTHEAAAVIRASGADLVALEEPTRFMAVSYPSLAALYPYASPCARRCDVAILSKRPLRRLTSASYDPSRPPGERVELSLLQAEVDGPDGRAIAFAATHLLWPTPPFLQQAQRRRLAAMLAPSQRAGLILAGDFNLTPWSFAMRGLDHSLAPLSRRTHGVLTFPARRLGPIWTPVLAIDQVYAGPDWRTLRVERLPSGGSDHYPVLATLVRR